MRINQVPFTLIEWEREPVTEVPGKSGTAQMRSVIDETLCVRMVDFTPGYSADHWCAKGHIAFVIAGSMKIVLEDGRSFDLRAGSSFHLGDQAGRHRVSSDAGAKVFIVD
ncbi:MAG TPA: DHCW motif cupin fold protein [Acidobacteriaceae bacterium]|nr:DHCW motif cupin fold protein [Acidobacteriaceae bacterium]